MCLCIEGCWRVENTSQPAADKLLVNSCLKIKTIPFYSNQMFNRILVFTRASGDCFIKV